MKKETTYDKLLDVQPKKKNVVVLNRIKQNLIFNAIRNEIMGRQIDDIVEAQVKNFEIEPLAGYEVKNLHNALRDFPSQPEPKPREPPTMKRIIPEDEDPIFKGLIRPKSVIQRVTNKPSASQLIQDVFKKSNQSI